MKKESNRRKNFVKMPLTLVACTLFLLCAFVYSGHSTAIHRTIQNATSHRPETFTELYFSDYKTMPKQLKAGKIYPVTLTITNHEAKTVTYTYMTTLTGRNVRAVSKPVNVTVNSGQSVSKVAHLYARQSGDHIELVVQVLNKNLTIHYKAQS